MIFFDNTTATVWEIYDKGKYVGARISTGVKDKKSGKYVNSHWNARFVGECVDLAKTLQRGERIKINRGGIESIYNKDKKQTYVNVVIFDFEGSTSNFTPVEDDDVELPF